tara:strand:+ start:10151 stop:10375 length:225 start_codon:yes stop_codon:yes gene_type:complete
MTTNEVKELIENGLKGSKAIVNDDQNSGDHFSATVIWHGFEGMSLIQQHKAVYETVSNFLTKEIHALQLKTKIK